MPIAHCLASHSSLLPYRGSICTPRQTKWSARWTSANMHWKLRRRGYLTIREAAFETSSHCALVNEDRKKYWNSVKVLTFGVQIPISPGRYYEPRFNIGDSAVSSQVRSFLLNSCYGVNDKFLLIVCSNQLACTPFYLLLVTFRLCLRQPYNTLRTILQNHQGILQLPNIGECQVQPPLLVAALLNNLRLQPGLNLNQESPSGLDNSVSTTTYISSPTM